ncbi:MAG: EAL domain-containing protein [Gammaproteobacteria bacterium]|nr:EAL domain-containing protein [Gammaproteobacteria bacterium]
MSTKIVVVEDERIVALNLQQRLIKLGYEVPAMAVSAQQALSAVESSHPDIVLMDIHIEGDTDGIDAAEILMKKHQTPVIYLTAYSEENTLRRARNTKPYGYLLKPFSERELHATIQMALERRQYELMLSGNEQRLRLAMEAAGMGEWELTGQNSNPQMLYAGQADIIFGYPESTFFGDREQFMNLVFDEDQPAINAAIDASIEQNATIDVEFRSKSLDDTLRWLRLQGKMLQQPNHKLHMIGVIQNVTERKQAEKSLHQASMVFDATQDGILILDAQGRVLTCNSSFSLITGYAADDMVGEKPFLLSRDVLRRDQPVTLQNVLNQGGQWRGEIKITCKNGVAIPTLVSIVTVYDNHDKKTHFILVLTDLTAVRSAEQKLHYLAHHDPLTDLPNRLLTFERLNQALLRGKRHSERVAVFFIDLDNFKWINDSLGHSIGDKLLKAISERIIDCLRADDTIGRLGGDEFLIVLDPVESVQSVALVAQKLLRAVSQPLQLDAHMVEVSCSIGISMFPENGQYGEDLVRAADTAMYAAKAIGRNNCEFFTPAMMEKAQRYLALNHDLHRGFQAGELRLYYQPQISLLTGEITTMEVLLRWQHPTRGLLAASEIIPIAEDCGMIVDIGTWVLRESCAQLARWREAGIPKARLAVNVSALQIHKSNFIEIVKEVYDACQIDPGTCEIEITESTLQHEENCIGVLQQLKAMGVQITIDDFGTGYSCLSSLKLLPITKLKIDKSFVNDLVTDENDTAIVQAIIAMAHKLNLEVVAEGVETPEQERKLRDNGCDIAQGYLYYRPMSVDQVNALLASKAPGPTLS